VADYRDLFDNHVSYGPTTPHDAPDLWLNDLRTFFATLTGHPTPP
jgi:hypothetical protein